VLNSLGLDVLAVSGVSGCVIASFLFLVRGTYRIVTGDMLNL
jgi:hypothetical protein